MAIHPRRPRRIAARLNIGSFLDSPISTSQSKLAAPVGGVKVHGWVSRWSCGRGSLRKGIPFADGADAMVCKLMMKIRQFDFGHVAGGALCCTYRAGRARMVGRGFCAGFKPASRAFEQIRLPHLTIAEPKSSGRRACDRRL